MTESEDDRLDSPIKHDGVGAQHSLKVDGVMLADALFAEDERMNEYRAALLARWLNFLRIQLCLEYFGQTAAPDDLAVEAEESILRKFERQYPGFDARRFRQIVIEDSARDGQQSSGEPQDL